MNGKNIFAALACALLALGLVGCGAVAGTTNHLQSITLGASLINGVAPTGQSGFFTLQGNGGTIQLLATGNYSSGQTKDLTNEVTYSVMVDPNYSQDAFGNTLVPPCTPPTCPVPASGPPYTSGTVEYSPTGLITSVEPATCTWVDVAPVVTPGTPPTPAWFYVGDYVVTVSFEGITSQPVYIPVASSAGNPNNPALGTAGVDNNPTDLCGPTS